MAEVSQQEDTNSSGSVQGLPGAEGQTPPSEPKVSQHLLDLAKKERAIRHHYKQLKAEKEALKAKETEYQSKYIDRTRIQQDPISVLNELGLSQEQIAQLLLNSQQQQQQDPYLSKVEQKLKAIEDFQKQSEERQQQQAKTQYEQAVQQIRNDVTVLVGSDERFESIKEMKAEDAVVELIKKTFDSEGLILSAEEAASQVEDYIFEEASRMLNLKKIKAKFQSTQATEESREQKSPAMQRTPTLTHQIRTLTNSQTTTPSKPLGDKERRERAILAFQGMLK